MHYAYAAQGNRLTRLDQEARLAEALWIDLIQPTDTEIALLRDLGVTLPSLAEMEEIELSNRLYREDGLDYMTAVLPGEKAGGDRVSMPVTFILSDSRLVTVRHHSPRPFLTFPARAERSTLGCSSAERLFTGLLEEIIARLADILEGAGRTLDEPRPASLNDARSARVRTACRRRCRTWGARPKRWPACGLAC